MPLDSIWRLVPRFSKFLIFSSLRLLAEVPRNRANADLNAKAISLLPQVFHAVRALSDSPWADSVAGIDVTRANALLATVGEFHPSAWRHRQRSVLQFGPRPLVAHTCDESIAAAIAMLPELVGSLRFLIGTADADAVQRVAPFALKIVRITCWDSRLTAFWQDGAQRFPVRSTLAVQKAVLHRPHSVEQGEEDYFTARSGRGAA